MRVRLPQTIETTAKGLKEKSKRFEWAKDDNGTTWYDSLEQKQNGRKKGRDQVRRGFAGGGAGKVDEVV